MLTKVAVYGTLRKAQGNHRLMSTARYVGMDKVPGCMHSLGGFPAVDLADTKRQFVIEVYEVDDPTLHRLDQLEGYPGWYHRSEIETQYGKAFIYHMTDDQLHGRPVIESGNWAVHAQERTENYFKMRNQGLE